ncbi:MAG: hypothetical protein KY445_12455 [Armatimonadetes bacterium]|nr:hypothetical protein [Armatimonadota bacterium]
MTVPTPQTPPALPAKPVSAPDMPLWGRMELLWLVMAPLCALIFALCSPLAPNDLWYHVRAGEFIARGAIPNQNGMSNGVALDAPYYYQSWLAELGLFATLQLGGLSGLALLRGFCLSATLGLVVVASFRRLLRLSPAPSRLLAARLSAFSALVGLAILSNNVDLRPQTFSVFFFGAWIFAVGEFRAQNGTRRARWGAFLVALTAIWANTHGAFAVSVLGLAALALGDSLSRHPRARFSWGIAAASFAAVALNPRGLGLYVYVAQLSNNEIGQRFIQEWKSPGLDEWHSALFWLTALGVTAWWLLSRRASKTKNENWGEVAAFGLFFVMAARDQRAMIWFALWTTPLLASLAAQKFASSSMAERPLPRAAWYFNAALLAFLLLCPLAFLPTIKPSFPWPNEFARRFAPTPASLFAADPPLLLENTTPVAAAQWLRRNPPRGLVFTDMVCGSYLTWATHPDIKPWCDPRIELFPVAFWEDYLRLSSGPRDAADELARRGFSDALLDRETQPGLVRRLEQSPQWQIKARSGSTILFRHSAR